MAVSDIQDPSKIDFKYLQKLAEESRHECISRSGMVDLDHTRGYGSNFSLIFLAAFTETLANSEPKDLLTGKFKSELVNRFMAYHHELFVEKQHYNWNWD